MRETPAIATDPALDLPGEFRALLCMREMAAFIGLVPRQASTGGRPVLLGISKRGDRYLRARLIHGARSVLRTAHKGEQTRLKQWAQDVKRRRHANVATVAVANKLARIAWAVLRDEDAIGRSVWSAADRES